MLYKGTDSGVLTEGINRFRAAEVQKGLWEQGAGFEPTAEYFAVVPYLEREVRFKPSKIRAMLNLALLICYQHLHNSACVPEEKRALCGIDGRTSIKLGSSDDYADRIKALTLDLEPWGLP